MAENSAVQQAVAALGRFFMGDSTVEKTLHRVAALTVEALPQTRDVGITMMSQGKPTTAIFTDPEVPEIDEAQYRTGSGPCLDAYRYGNVHYVASTRRPGPWPEYQAMAARHGIFSTLSLPMTAQDTTVGALNMYAAVEDAYSPDDCDLASLFATQGAYLLVNAQTHADCLTLNENMQQALVSRAVIEQAKGIIMGSTHCDEEQAFQVLVDHSQHQNVKLRDVAREIVQMAKRQRR
jgi:transcriptional regulator with GAF, ATPase, and Fis domain